MRISFRQGWGQHSQPLWPNLGDRVVRHGQNSFKLNFHFETSPNPRENMHSLLKKGVGFSRFAGLLPPADQRRHRIATRAKRLKFYAVPGTTACPGLIGVYCVSEMTVSRGRPSPCKPKRFEGCTQGRGVDHIDSSVEPKNGETLAIGQKANGHCQGRSPGRTPADEPSPIARRHEQDTVVPCYGSVFTIRREIEGRQIASQFTLQNGPWASMSPRPRSCCGSSRSKSSRFAHRRSI